MQTLNGSELSEAKRLLNSDSPALADAGARILAKADDAESSRALRRRLLDPTTSPQTIAAICAETSRSPLFAELDATLASHLFGVWRRHHHPAIGRFLERGVTQIDPQDLVPALLDDTTFDSALRLLVLSKSPAAYEGGAEWLLSNSGHIFTLTEFAGIEADGITEVHGIRTVHAFGCNPEIATCFV